MFFHGSKAGFTAALVVLTITGCAPTDQVEKRPDLTTNCKADDYRTLLWKPSNAINAANLPKNVRIIYPDQAVTADYRENRLNIKIGKLDRIEQVFCG
jgi:hypothetical protein